MAKKIYDSEDDGKSKVKQTESKEVGLWHERISMAKRDQDRWADESGAKRFIKEYKGDYGIVFHGRNRKFPVPPINEVFAYVQSDIATTYNRDPYITVNAEAGSVRGAAFWEVILNYYWRVLKTKEELEYEILDKDLVGYGFHKVGYTADSIGDGENAKIESETIYSSYVSWRDVLWNVGSKRPPTDCIWMAQRVVKPINEIKKMFPSAKGMEGVPMPNVETETYKKTPYKDDIKVGVIWEIWDKEKMQVLLIAEGLKDRYLAPPRPWPEYKKDFPFRMYWDFAVPDSSRPMSAIAPWEPQILEEMIIMGSAINHAKRWNRQAFVKNGTIDENSLDKYERGDDGAIITYNGDSADIKFADFGQLPTDFYLLMDRLQSIKRNINGQPEFVRGGVTKTGTRTVGELQMMQKGATGRQDRKIDRLETHCENIARDLLGELKANFDFGSSVKITGDTPEHIIEALGDNFDPQTGTVTFTAEDIKGEYDVDVKAGSTLPMDKQNRMQIYETILTSVAQVVSRGPMSPFLNALIQGLLEDYDVKALQQAYEQEVQQVQKQQQEAAQSQNVEQEKIQAETAKRAAQAKQISVDTVISGQEAMLGPQGRAMLEKAVKSNPSSNGGQS